MTGRSLAAVLVLGAAVAGCSSTANPVRDVFTDFGAGPPATTAPDFVTQTRPANLDYIPVQRAGGPSTAARSPEEMKKLEAELEAARQRNEAQGEAARRLGQTPPPTARRP